MEWNSRKKRKILSNKIVILNYHLKKKSVLTSPGDGKTYFFLGARPCRDVHRRHHYGSLKSPRRRRAGGAAKAATWMLWLLPLPKRLA